MSGVISFKATEFLENTTGTGDSEFTRQSSYCYPKNSFKKMFSRRYTTNRDSSMVVNGAVSASTSPVLVNIDGTTTSAADLKRGQKLTLEGTGGSIGTVRGVNPDANLLVSGPLANTQFILNSLNEDLPDNTKLFFSSDEAIIFIQFDTEGDLVDRDQVYMFVDREFVDIVINTISKELTNKDYTSIESNQTTGIGRHIRYIHVTAGESVLLD
tara:strand:+ start:538 stop:1176 length:639 start_codon:yes stop_codon:yes gene_type:complete